MYNLNLYSVSYFRFIYVRHGYFLVVEGTRLLHILSLVFVTMYMVSRNTSQVWAMTRGTRHMTVSGALYCTRPYS